MKDVSTYTDPFATVTSRMFIQEGRPSTAPLRFVLQDVFRHAFDPDNDALDFSPFLVAPEECPPATFPSVDGRPFLVSFVVRRGAPCPQ